MLEEIIKINFSLYQFDDNIHKMKVRVCKKETKVRKAVRNKGQRE